MISLTCGHIYYINIYIHKQTHKQNKNKLKDIDNILVVTRDKGVWQEGKICKVGQMYDGGWKLDFGSEYNIVYKDLNCTLESYEIVLTNVTSIKI